MFNYIRIVIFLIWFVLTADDILCVVYLNGFCSILAQINV